MESFEHQEERARKHLSIPAVIKAALLAGIVTYILPGGGPWMSTEGFQAVMGRIITQNMLLALPLNLLLAFIYGFIIAGIIYSMPTFVGIVVGTLLAFPLAGLNYLFFSALLGYPANELHVVICHVLFALLFSTTFRALAVPKPLKN